MINLFAQLKTQPTLALLRQILLLACACAVGCQQESQRSDVGSADAPPDRVVASLNAMKADSDFDGQRLGDSVSAAELSEVKSEFPNPSVGDRGDGHLLGDEDVPALPSELLASDVAPEVREGLQRIRLLRGREIAAEGAAALEIRRRRNFRIVEIATRTLPLAMKAGESDSAFLQLIRHLLEARLELAVSGGRDDVQALYRDVKALTDRDSQSLAAAEGVYTLARFAHEMARRHGSGSPDWFHCFTRWSQEFARRFPFQPDRAIALLMGSARSCEIQSLEGVDKDLAARLRSDAVENYKLLVDQFDSTSASSDATAALRRLDLPGKTLQQFSGETLDGHHIDGSQFVDVVTVIYFWDDRDPEFVERLLPLLQQADAVSNGQLKFVGVPLNDQRQAVQDFLLRNSVPGAQIFSDNDKHAGWNHPLVRFWGIARGATCWLIDRDQTVAAIDVTAEHLVDQMRQLFRSE